MRIFSGVFGLVVIVLVLSFVLSNRQDVTVGLWPFIGSLQAPLYAVGLAPLAFGFAFGGFLGWLGGVPHRLRAMRLNKELVSLSGRLGELQKNAKAKPKPSFWKRLS